MTNPASRTAPAMRYMVWKPLVKASMTGWAMRLSMSCRNEVSFRSMALPFADFAISRKRWLAGSAATAGSATTGPRRGPCSMSAIRPRATPNITENSTATPVEPPIWRHSPEAALATPSSLLGAAFCMARVTTVWARPMPTPSHRARSATVHSGVPASMTLRTSRAPAMDPRPTIASFLNLPEAEISLPETIWEAMVPTISGMTTSPACVGVRPCTSWRKSGRVVTAPKMPTPMVKLTPVHRATPPVLKSRSGRMASTPRRASTTRNRTSPTTPRAMRISAVGEDQPQARPCSATISRGTRNSARSRAPRTSMRCSVRWCGRSSALRTVTRASRPRGTLATKIQRQPSRPRVCPMPASAPPASGPMTLAATQAIWR